MWNNGTLHPIRGMFVDDTVCPVVPKGSTWARNPVPRIHTDNIGMAFVGGCWGQNGPPGEVGWRDLWQSEAKTTSSNVNCFRCADRQELLGVLTKKTAQTSRRPVPTLTRAGKKIFLWNAKPYCTMQNSTCHTLRRRFRGVYTSLKNIILWLTRPAKVRWECNAHANGICCTGR